MKKVMIALLSVVGSLAFAGGSTGVGPSYCSYGTATCSTGDDSLVVCPFDKRDEAYVAVGGKSVGFVPMKEVPLDRRQIGAGRLFEGKGFSLYINTDGPVLQSGYWSGFSSEVTIESLGIENQRLYCRIN